MANLRTDHPYLYRRINRKGLVHILLGVALLLTPPLQVNEVSIASNVIARAGLDSLGYIFGSLGLLIILSTFHPKNNYSRTRNMLYFTFLHDMVWFLILVLSTVAAKGQGLSLLILWGYLCYNLFETASDPGFKAVQIIKDLRQEHQDSVDEGHARSLKKSTDKLKGMTEDARSNK